MDSQPHAVTSMMQPTPPHDHQSFHAPPYPPRSSSHSHTPRPIVASIHTAHHTADPHNAYNPRGAHSFDPRDGLSAVRPRPKTCLPFTSSSAVFTSSNSHSPKMTAFLPPQQQILNMYATGPLPGPSTSTQYQLLHYKLGQQQDRPRTMSPAFSARKQQLFTRKKSFAATVSDNVSLKTTSSTASSVAQQAASDIQAAAKSKAKELMNKLHITRTAAEIFDKNFGFSMSSRRRARDPSPQVSPRTSFSEGSWPPTPSCILDEPRTRHRVDSTDSGISGFPFGKAKEQADFSCGRDFASPAHMFTRNTSYSEATGEAHPGQPVSFTCPSATNMDEEVNALFFQGALSPENSMILPSAEVSPVTSQLLSLSPSRPHSYPMDTPTPTQRRFNEDARMLAALDTSPLSPTTLAGRKRACTEEERQDSIKRPAPTPPSYTPRPFVTVQQDPFLRRAVSDSSAEMFLAHVRASFEARRVRQMCMYDIFCDEKEKGFLDESPL